MTFTAETSVADIATAVPASIRVFQRYGIDFCCGGRTPLGTACRSRHVEFDEVAGAITAAASAKDEDERDWSREPAGALADYIVQRFHNPLREELPWLQQLARRMQASHRDKAPAIVDGIGAALGELSAELLQHMAREEQILFPAIRRIDAGAEAGLPIEMPIAVMEQEHDDAGALLARLRELTAGYTPPEWACRTVRALYDGLGALEREMHVHVHLENNVLFPRALEAAGRRPLDLA